MDDLNREVADMLNAISNQNHAWGFASPDSDYDVRFIYVHPKENYLSVDEQRDVIELPINDLLDINGWELRKALRSLPSVVFFTKEL